MKFQTQDVTLAVSRMNQAGLWLGNSKESVAKGTALGSDFTENIYTPSSEGMIGKYDATTDSWTEIKNHALDEFWNEIGDGFVIGTPDGVLPEGAIEVAPPQYDKETQTVLFKDDSWATYEIELGREYWNSEGFMLIVSEYNFTLPSEHSWIEPPETKTGYVIRLVDDKWTAIVDLRESIIYNTATQVAKTVESIGEIEAGWTLDAPLECSVWEDEKWVQTVELMLKAKHAKVNAWRALQDADNSKTINVNDIDWDAGPTSRARIESTLQSQFTPPFWTDANDIDQPITADNLQEMLSAIVEYGFTIHTRQREMKAEISALTTCEAINNYLIGWSNASTE